MKRFFSLFIAIVFMSGAVIATGADLYSNIMPKNVISPDTSVSNNDNTTGTIVDRLGYGSTLFIIQTGTLADNDVTLTPTIQVCALDNCADAASAASAELIGTVAGATFADTDDNTIKSIGYKGTARYLRLVITPANNSGAARFNAACLLGHKQYGPAQ